MFCSSPRMSSVHSVAPRPLKVASVVVSTSSGGDAGVSMKRLCAAISNLMFVAVAMLKLLDTLF